MKGKAGRRKDDVLREPSKDRKGIQSHHRCRPFRQNAYVRQMMMTSPRFDYA